MPKTATDERTRRHPDDRAGIHYSDPGKLPHDVSVSHGEELTAEQRQQVKAALEVGIAQRLDGTDPLIHRPDEHWLQAVTPHLDRTC